MVGQNIGKYRVIDRIGRGGMGTVFRALDETLSRDVAIKILNAELNDPEVARRFRAEAVTVARLNHPGIATIYELFQHDGQWMMVMEFVRGETLEHMVEHLGPLSPQRAVDLCTQTLAALSHAHRMGVVHRDLKPANLMITESGAVKIMDFGIARVAGSEHLTSAGFLMGTPAYMAPEQVTGDEIDARTDLYAIGVVFYYLVSARLPFKGETPIAMAQSRVVSQHTPVGLVRDGLPAWIEPLIDRALSKTPADRFQTADQFKEALRRGLAGLPMESQAGAVVPPELVTTSPPGTLPMSTPPSTPSSAIPVPPTSQGATPPKTIPPASPALPKLPTAAAMPMSTSASGKVRMPTAASGVPAPAAAPRAPQKAKTTNQSVIALGAAAVVLIGLIGWTWTRTHPAPEPATDATTTAATSTPDAAPPSPTPPEATPDAAGASAAASPTPGAVSAGANQTGAATPAPPGTPGSPPRSGAAGSSGAVPPAPGAAGTTTGGAVGSAGAMTTGSGVTPTASAPGRGVTPPPTGRGAAADTDHVAFSDVKYLIVKGQHADDEDSVLNFVAGQISVTSKKGGPALASEPYRRIAHATYVHAKMPKWDATLPAPPDGFDVPGIGFLRTAHHWLVLQSKTDFMILRLEDSNWRQVLDTFETRTGLKVDRPPAGDK
jgi:serine/threonine protein kinase